MDPPSRSSLIIVGAGISRYVRERAYPARGGGVPALRSFVLRLSRTRRLLTAKVLAENGVEDILILEATDRIGGRIRNEAFGGVSVELGAGSIVGVGGKVPNPVWELAAESSLRTCFSDYGNARYNIYDRSGKIFPSGLAAASYKKAVDSAIENLRNQQETDRGGYFSRDTEPPSDGRWRR